MKSRPPPSGGARSPGAPCVRRRVPPALALALEIVAELRARQREEAEAIVAELRRRS